MIRIPKIIGTWLQRNVSDVLSVIWSSFNLDLRSNEGHVRVSPRTIVNTDDITDLGVAVGFDIFSDQNAGIQYFWAVAGGYVFRAVTTNAYITAFAKDTATGTPNNICSSDISDIAHYGKTFMVVTTTTDIYYFTASSGQWADSSANNGEGGGTPLSTGSVHMLCTYGDRFYVTDVNTKVRSFTTSDFNTVTTSGSNFLNLGNKAWNVTSISTLRPSSTRIWVGTINQSENGCWVFAWDGVNATDPNEAYFIPDASGVLACLIVNDNPWVIDNNGVLRYLNGGTFVEAPFGRLPIKYPKFLKNSLSAVNDRWIHPNGMQLKDGRIRILVNNQNDDNGTTIEENFPSGIWEYDSATGWIHVQSISYHAASAGSVTDYGQNRVSRVGALFYAKDDSNSSTANGTMLGGAQIYSNASDTKEVIFTDDSNDTLQKFGYLVTPKIYSPNIQDVWNTLVVRHRELLDSTDRIWVRYRTTEDDPVEATITWTSSTTFTTTTNVSAYENYEVEVIQGKGSGRCEKITSVSESGGTYTVTVDSAFTGATSGTAKARFQYWQQAGPAASSQTVSFDKFTLDATSTWIQLKVCMQFKGRDEVDDLILLNTKSE